jgi:tRNA threonylcarbamoyladenosine biosynthesis protein TsaE
LAPDQAQVNTAAIQLRATTSDDTVEIGRVLGQWLAAGDVVLLRGHLGAGKTTLAQGIAAGVGVADYVTSPSFTIVNEYRPARSGAHPVFYHLDLYRISGAAEALDFGLDEYVDGDGIAVVEWAERAAEAMPVDCLSIRLVIADYDTGERRIEMAPAGDRLLPRLDQLRAHLAPYALNE